MRDESVTISIAGPTDAWLRGWGSMLLYGAFGFAMVLVLLITWKADWVLPFIPVVLLGGVGAWWLFQRPLLNLAVVLCCFVLIADYEDGIQVSEVFYGLYYFGFLSVWFFKRLFLDPRPVFERGEEKAIWLFLILATLSIPLTLVFGGTFKMWLGEWLSLTFLGFYFPIKETIREEKHGMKVIIGVVFFIGMFVLVRNVSNYMNALSNAEQAWQILKGRAVTNEGLLMVPAFFALSLFLFSDEWKQRVLFLGLFIAFFGGLILTQSRGYWLAFLFGSGILFFVFPTKQKRRLLSTGAISSLVIFGTAVLIFGDVLFLVVSGLLDRFLSIGSSTSTDISLLNRFVETGAVWELVKTNPILGHGMGVSYRFFNIIDDFSESKTFIHNGYVALLFKFGMWGTPLLLGFLTTIVVRARNTFKLQRHHLLNRTVAIAVFGSFLAFSVSANTSNPFYINDTMFIFSIMAGMVGGGFRRDPDQERRAVVEGPAKFYGPANIKGPAKVDGHIN